MEKLTSFLRQHVAHRSQPSSTETSPTSTTTEASANLPFPSKRDWYRYRKQRGVNLGSWFVLERWIAEAPYKFSKDPGQSDLDVARGSYAKQMLERHWDSWITDKDFAWIAAKGINTVRIPIGYYHLSGVDSSVVSSTDFSGYQHAYRGAWDRITNAIVLAEKYGIGVLFDLHAAPGKQNKDAHSGTSSNNVQFFNKSNMAHTTRILVTLLTHLSEFTRSHDPPLHNVVGIELLNEPQPGSQRAALEKWYMDTIRALRNVDSSFPIYLGDAWLTDQYADLLVENGQPDLPFLVLDHHLYRCFTEEDGKMNVGQHIENLTNMDTYTPQLFSRVSKKLEGAGGGGGLVIGEWSGALNPGSLHGVPNEKDARRNFVNAQLNLFEKTCAGWFFWTYRKEHIGDLGWCLRDAVEGDVFPSWVGIRARQIPGDNSARTGRREKAKDKAFKDHVSYWERYPGNYEHWRFEEGFFKGWDDGYWFFTSSAEFSSHQSISELGFKGPWTKKRLQEHVREKGSSKALWEFEHGFTQGLSAARSDLGA